MDTFLKKLQELGVGGVHLGMVASNAGARRFYERLGFQLCDGVLDDGASGELGRKGDAVCLVKQL
jgi:RimJ/RimL family protein N-acetyltransferase